MASAPAEPLRSKDSVLPIRTITRGDLNWALREGWNDFLSMRGDLLFLGVIYVFIGLAAAVVMLGGNLLWLIFPAAAGLSLVGPVAAVGFYELAHRREAGLEANWAHFLDVGKRPSRDGIAVVGSLLVAIWVLWIAVAAILYALLWGLNTPPTLGGFLARLFGTPEGWALIVLGNGIGFLFAATVLATSVVSMPMLVDRNVDARTAVQTSLAAFRANRAVLLRWGLIVAALLVAGSIPAFIGLAVVLPWLGYSTWHLYTRLVDREAVAQRL